MTLNNGHCATACEVIRGPLVFSEPRGLSPWFFGQPTGTKPRGSLSTRMSARRSPLPPLENGDPLDQRTFHARYEAMPANVTAELVGGIVYLKDRARTSHGRLAAHVLGWMGIYEEATRGVQALGHPSVILGDESEPQPDGCLIILPEYGGQTSEDEDEYMVGSPEFIAEIASSTESIDLHGKRLDYERAGVREYMVAAVRQRQVFWWVRRKSKFKPLAPDDDGVIRSVVFPGLWLDPKALLVGDLRRMLAVLRQGLATPEHTGFVQDLAGRRKAKS